MIKLARLPEPLSRAVTRETQGETVRWWAQPSPGGVFRNTLPIWLMGFPWSALAFTIFGFVIAFVISDKEPGRVIPIWEYALMGAAIIFVGSFALIGIGMLGAPFWAWWQARHTAFVITDERLIILRVGRSVDTKSVMPDQITGFERHEKRNGSGTLKITIGYERDSDGNRTEVNEHLIGIADVAEVEQMLRQLKKRAA